MCVTLLGFPAVIYIITRVTTSMKDMMHLDTGTEGTLDCLLVPKRFKSNVFLFVGSTTFSTFIGCFIKLSIQTFQPLQCNL